jgi:hypothetical protein
MNARLIITSALLAVCALASGCSSQKAEKPSGKAYSVAFRQLPPQPVYNRVGFAHLPEVVPSRELPRSNAANLDPVVHLELKNSTLEEASAVLAAVSRYTNFCSSTIASQRISLNTLGTMQELAEQIAVEAGIKVVVDHENRQVRFLTGTVAAESDSAEVTSIEEPKFLDAAE